MLRSTFHYPQPRRNGPRRPLIDGAIWSRIKSSQLWTTILPNGKRSSSKRASRRVMRSPSRSDSLSDLSRSPNVPEFRIWSDRAVLQYRQIEQHAAISSLLFGSNKSCDGAGFWKRRLRCQPLVRRWPLSAPRRSQTRLNRWPPQGCRYCRALGKRCRQLS